MILENALKTFSLIVVWCFPKNWRGIKNPFANRNRKLCFPPIFLTSAQSEEIKDHPIVHP